MATAQQPVPAYSQNVVPPNPNAVLAPDPYAPVAGQPVTPGVTEAGLQGLYQRYYGTATPPVSAFESNYGNPGGLSAVETLMKADPNNLLNAQPTSPVAPVAPPAGNTTPPTTNGVVAPFVLPGSTPTGMNDPNASAFFQTLMSNLTTQPNVDPNDPIIKAETDAYAANQTRGARGVISADAEAAGPYGAVGSSGISNEARLASETAGQNTATFQAGLEDSERSARRTQIQNILSLGGSFLTSEQQLQLQQELSQMSLEEQAYQFDTTTAANASPFAAGASA